MILISQILNSKYKLDTKRIIEEALKEDIPKQDITSDLLIENNSVTTADILPIKKRFYAVLKL